MLSLVGGLADFGQKSAHVFLPFYSSKLQTSWSWSFLPKHRFQAVQFRSTSIRIFRLQRWSCMSAYPQFTYPRGHNPFTESPHAVVNSERPCNALIVEVVNAEYANPPVNPIKWSELPVVWRESAICFQDLSRQRSKVLVLHVGPNLWQKTATENSEFADMPVCQRANEKGS